MSWVEVWKCGRCGCEVLRKDFPEVPKGFGVMLIMPFHHCPSDIILKTEDGYIKDEEDSKRKIGFLKHVGYQKVKE